MRTMRRYDKLAGMLAHCASMPRPPRTDLRRVVPKLAAENSKHHFHEIPTFSHNTPFQSLLWRHDPDQLVDSDIHQSPGSSQQDCASNSFKENLRVQERRQPADDARDAAPEISAAPPDACQLPSEKAAQAHQRSWDAERHPVNTEQGLQSVQAAAGNHRQLDPRPGKTKRRRVGAQQHPMDFFLELHGRKALGRGQEEEAQRNLGMRTTGVFLEQDDSGDICKLLTSLPECFAGEDHLT